MKILLQVMKNVFVITLIFIFSKFVVAQYDLDSIYRNMSVLIHESMMRSTFRITGGDSLGSEITGTCFMLKRSKTQNPIKEDVLLVTANHVLSSISDDYVVINYPEESEKGYVYYKKSIRIRNDGIPLWKSHNDTTIDIAVVKLAIGNFHTNNLVSTDYLASEEVLEQFQIRPGDILYCVGFPEGASANEYGFPILKSGVIASYPILPSILYKYFLYDCELFPASSGSPVYLCEAGRLFIYEHETVFEANMVQLICGIIVSKQFVGIKSEKTENGQPTNLVSLQLAKVIPSTFILEIIESIY